LVGSGCSSVVTFLLGMSDVDPIGYHLPFQRFYPTGRDTPRFLISVGAINGQQLDYMANPETVRLTFMTRLEKAAWLCPVGQDISHSNKDCYELLKNDENQDIFQLDWAEIRALAAQLKPKRIPEIAAATGLAEIELSRPDIVQKFVQGQINRDAVPKDQRRFFISS